MQKIRVLIFLIAVVTSNGYAQKRKCNSLKKGIAAYLINRNGNVDKKKIIPFHLIDGLILIDAEVNGVKGKIMFDTATPFDFFFNDERINLDTTNVVVRGAAGTGQPIVVYNSNEKTTIRLEGWGEDIIHNNNFHTQLEFISEGFDTKLIGTMGFGFLKNYEFTINYDTQLITLYPIDENGNLLSKKSKPSSTNKFVLHFHNENEEHIPKVDVDVCGLKIPASFDTGSRGVVRFSEKTFKS